MKLIVFPPLYDFIKIFFDCLVGVCPAKLGVVIKMLIIKRKKISRLILLLFRGVVRKDIGRDVVS